MSASQKDFLSKWGPLILSIFANIAILSYSYGKTEVRISTIETQVAQVSRDKLVAYLVTRNEYEQRVNSRDREMQQNRDDHKAIMEKLDRLIERSDN